MYACMYVCMYVRMYVCMHACMYECMYVQMYVRMSVCMYPPTSSERRACETAPRPSNKHKQQPTNHEQTSNKQFSISRAVCNKQQQQTTSKQAMTQQTRANITDRRPPIADRRSRTKPLTTSNEQPTRAKSNEARTTSK